MGDPYPAICDYEGSDYQESFWDRGGRAYEDRAEALALARLLPPGGQRLLEVGAGAGRHTPRYRNFEEITLLDYSRSQLEQARQRLGDSAGYRYVVADVYRLPFGPGAFDAATMIRTLHHMADPAAALRRIRLTLSPGATFVLEYANKRNLKAILRWLVRRQSWSPFSQDSVEFTRLNYDFHPHAVRSWLGQAGFIVERQVPVSFLRVAGLKRIVPLPLLLVLESLLQRLGAAALVTPSVFIRSRATRDPVEPRKGFWRCPACDSLDLIEGSDGVDCRGCGRHWPKRGGIFEFRQPSPDDANRQGRRSEDGEASRPT
jgi:ubiquinone/menaquinone biosynthesis C-methylase UbiE